MSNQITTTYHFDCVYFATVSNGEKSIRVEPGPDFLKDLEEAKKICNGEIVDYTQEILEAIAPLYYKAKESKENLQFFEALNFFCKNSQELIEMGYERIWRTNHETT